MTVAAVMATATPAPAAEGDGEIQDGEFVVWRDCDFKGPFVDFAADHTTYRGFAFREELPPDEDEPPGGEPAVRVDPVDNNTSAVANLSTVNSVNAYLGAGFSGPRLVVLPGQRFDLCVLPSVFNDQVSSHHF
jgi:hypothetical protein